MGLLSNAFLLTAEFWRLFTFPYLHPFSAHFAFLATQFPDAAIAVWSPSSPLVTTYAGASDGVALQVSIDALKSVAHASLTLAGCFIVVLHCFTNCQLRGRSGTLLW